MKKQNKVVYAIILLCIIVFIYINKKIFLEGYTYNSNLTFSNVPPPTIIQPLINNVHLSTCKLQCDTNSTCKYFVSNLNEKNTRTGSCSLFSSTPNSTQHALGSHFYVK